MSYCRWSSDNWRCDLYCYSGVGGGYTTHVAMNRVVGVGEIPKEPELTSPLPENFMADYKRVMAFLATAERRPIGLPCAGESFNDPDLESFLERVTMLRGLGYNVPDYVFEDIRAEIAEEGK